MIRKHYFTAVVFFISVISTVNSIAQCIWQTQLTDSFEYQTPCPDIIAGTTVHTIPQAFSVHSGSYSLYLNFINCNGTTGTCAGDTVYVRHFSVCRNMQYRFSSWFTTSFNGAQCNMKIVITDGNGNVLNSQPNVLAPYAPNWIQYNSGSVTPADDNIYFIMITNVGGGNGNDLSMDDFIMEQCFPDAAGISVTGNICSNLQQLNLFNFLQSNADSSGSWSGPSVLGGNHLGTFTVGTSVLGSYVYSSAYYGINSGCPLTTDTVTTLIVSAPSPSLGNDTTICTNQSLILLPGTFPGSTYLWNTGSTSPGIVASTTISTGDTTNYWVTVTSQSGCSATDTIQIIFISCTSLAENNKNNSFTISPNPTKTFISIDAGINLLNNVSIIDTNGKTVKNIDDGNSSVIFIGDLIPALYYLRVTINNNEVVQKFVKN